MPVHPLCVPSGLMREEENTKQRTGDHEINFLLFVTGNRRQETAGKVINNHSPLWKLNVRLWRGEVQGGRLGRRWENRKGSRITPPPNRTTLREGREPTLLPQEPQGLRAPQTLLTTPSVDDAFRVPRHRAGEGEAQTELTTCSLGGRGGRQACETPRKENAGPFHPCPDSPAADLRSDHLTQTQQFPHNKLTSRVSM